MESKGNRICFDSEIHLPFGLHPLDLFCSKIQYFRNYLYLNLILFAYKVLGLTFSNIRQHPSNYSVQKKDSPIHRNISKAEAQLSNHSAISPRGFFGAVSVYPFSFSTFTKDKINKKSYIKYSNKNFVKLFQKSKKTCFREKQNFLRNQTTKFVVWWLFFKLDTFQHFLLPIFSFYIVFKRFLNI